MNERSENRNERSSSKSNRKQQDTVFGSQEIENNENSPSIGTIERQMSSMQLCNGYVKLSFHVRCRNKHSKNRKSKRQLTLVSSPSK